MKTLALLPLLFLSSNSFGQGVWEEVVTIPNHDIREIGAFEDGSVFLRSETTKTKAGITVAFDDTLYKSSDELNWEVIGDLHREWANDVHHIKQCKFLSPTLSFQVGGITHQNGSTYTDTWFRIYRNNIIDTSIHQLPGGVPGTTAMTAIDRMMISDQGDIYIRIASPQALRHWNKAQASWDTLIRIHAIDAVDINRKNGDILAVTRETYTAPSPTTVYLFDGSTRQQLKRGRVPMDFLLDKSKYPNIQESLTHVNEEQWFFTVSKYFSRTLDNGNTWSDIDSLDAPIVTLTISESGYGYAATYANSTSSLYKTTNFGVSWQQQLFLLPFKIYDICIVDSLRAYFSNGKLYKTTTGGGSILLSTKDDSKKESVSNVSIYPNPIINNTCHLQYPADFSSEPIMVYDILGRTIIFTLPSVGSEKTTLELTQLPTGVYYVVMGKERLKLIKN